MVNENKGRLMKHRAIIVESRTKRCEGNYTGNDKTVMSLMQNSNYLAQVWLRLSGLSLSMEIMTITNSGFSVITSESHKKLAI